MQLDPLLVRIYATDKKTPVGAGILKTGGQIITCAHVVNRALGRPEGTVDAPQGRVLVDFPMIIDRKTLSAEVIFWRPPQPSLPGYIATAGDIAVLKPDGNLPIGVRPAALIAAETFWEHPFQTFGFPDLLGASAHGMLRARLPGNWVELEAEGRAIEPGFSGAPVWDERLSGVVGIIVAVRQRKDAQIAYMIPSNILIDSLPEELLSSDVENVKIEGYCLIPGGVFRMGGIIDLEHEVYVPTFHIARYPVTNSQWKQFVEAGGYTRQEYWTKMGWEWRRQPQNPAHFSQGNFISLPNNPVVGVSWYEAIAYTRWSAARTGMNTRLPTEAEWEKAASWDPMTNQKRHFPWGNRFNSNLCNTDEAAIRKITSIGQFSPQGDSAYGVGDLAGNVQEWIQSLYKPYPYKGDDGRNEFESHQARVLRGGSYMSTKDQAETTSRSRELPSVVASDIGFRVAIG